MLVLEVCRETHWYVPPVRDDKHPVFGSPMVSSIPSQSAGEQSAAAAVMIVVLDDSRVQGSYPTVHGHGVDPSRQDGFQNMMMVV
jgi:hypothetical protein